MAEAERFLFIHILFSNHKENNRLTNLEEAREEGVFGTKERLITMYTYKLEWMYNTEYRIPSPRRCGDEVIVDYRHRTFGAFGTFYAHRVIIAIVSINATG